MELLKWLFDIKLFIGFIKNGAFLPKLEEEEENELIQMLQDEGTKEEARRRLIEHNLRLVAHIVKKYDNTIELNEDLLSIGTIGLVKAIDSFSIDKKVKLATYASKCIENEILMTLRKDKHIATDSKLQDIIGYDKDGEEMELIDVIENDEIPIDELYSKNEQLDKLRKYLNVLEDRELEIIGLRYGLDNKPEMTQKEIAKKLDISRSYVSRIEKRALYKILQEFKKDEEN